MHEGNYYAQHKRGMKQPKDWPCNNQDHEQPSADTFAETKLLAKRRALKNQAKSLEEEIARGQAISCLGWDRDNQIVDQPRNEEH